MRYLIAAAGTGGHVFPGLAVGEALVDLGVARRDILYVGGDRLEATVYPDEGFPFLGLELRGLRRSFTLQNLTLPAVVLKAKRQIEEAIQAQDITAVLGMGGYVTVPAALAARKLRVPLYIAEQNAEAGLANRIATRWSDRTFVSFPGTRGLEHGEWVGNPVREPFWSFNRVCIRSDALARYDLNDDAPVLGVFGGSLGAGVINEAVTLMLESWQHDPIQVVHITGKAHHADFAYREPASHVSWKRVAFEDAMENFYAASDLVLARAGGAVAELSATSTPSILIPGRFGSTGHQTGNARFFSDAGAALVLPEPEIGRLGDLVSTVIFDRPRLANMADDAARIAKPNAAKVIAMAMMGREP